MCRERVGPAVGGEDGLVEGAVGVREPGGTLVVEVGEGALFQIFGGDVGRVEPGVAEADEFAGGFGDGADDGGVGFGGFGAGRVGEGEGHEGGIRCIAWAAFQLRTRAEGPELVNLAKENPHKVIIFAGYYYDGAVGERV